MHSVLDYDDLLKKYNELQLRVTQFSHVEQQLINLNDSLDHELVMYKRLNNFNSVALNIPNEIEFIEFISESIIDIFEVESSFVFIKFNNPETNSKLIAEGFHLNESNSEQIKSEIISIANNYAFNKSFILSEDIFNNHKELSAFSECLLFQFKEIEMEASVILLALISKAKRPTYSKLELRKKTIFSVFAQQVNILFSNKKKSEKIH
jgi:hypothetical protein